MKLDDVWIYMSSFMIQAGYTITRSQMTGWLSALRYCTYHTKKEYNPIQIFLFVHVFLGGALS